MDLFLAAGSILALGLSLRLFLKKDNRKANTLLGIMGLLISFSLALNFSYLSGISDHFPHIIGLDNANPFLIAPLIYLYTRALSQKDFQFRKRDVAHLLPFLLYFIYLSLHFFFEKGDYKIDFLRRLQEEGMPKDLLLSSYFKILQAFVYLGLSYKTLIAHRSQIKQEFSYTEKINLQWLLVFTLGMGFIYLVRLIGVSLPLVFDHINLGQVEALMELLNAVFIIVLLTVGLQQRKIYQSLQAEKLKATGPAKVKYADSKLSQDESLQILKKVQNYMLEEQAYLNHQLNIRDLADQIDVHPKSLSQVINEQLKVNFFNFVNAYRVEEVKKRLKDPQYDKLSLLGIAYECGFSSKSTFHSIFKKFTGQTPSAYKSASS